MIQAQVRLYLSLKCNLYQKFHRLKPKSLLCCCGSVAYHHHLRLKPYLDLRKRKRRDWNSMSNSEGYESDAPEELTAEQGIQQDQEIRKVQKENKARIVREGKERRRQWAQRITPRPTQEVESVQDVTESETHNEPMATGGMLPNDIVELLTAREKQVFLSDSEDEKTEVKPKKKKKTRNSGVDTVVLKEIPSAQCLQNSLEFLKKRKTQVSRSSSVLNNANQALRFLSNSGLLK